jgi:signal peptidase I
MINLLLAVTLACSSPCLLSIMAEGHGGGKEVIAKTGSMLPSIPIGSKLVVDESFYSLRQPRRFDIVVVRRDFRNPGDSAPAYNNVVARLVGLPGEAISIRRGNLYINGRRVKEPFPTKPCPREIDEAFPCREMAAVRIPVGHYFLLSDNRAESEDSRLSSPKPVPRIDLLGKVVRIILPTPAQQLILHRPALNTEQGAVATWCQLQVVSLRLVHADQVATAPCSDRTEA